MLTEPALAGGPSNATTRHTLGPRRTDAASAATSRSAGHGSPRPALPPRGAAPPQPAGLDIGLLIGAVRRGIPLIVALALLGGVLGYGLQHRLKPRYTAAVSLVLEPKRSTSFGSAYVDEATIASVVSVMVSSDLLERVVTREHLDQVPEFGDAVPSRLHRWFGFLPFIKPATVDNSAEARFDRALGKLEQSLHADRVGYTYVVTIAASAGDPRLAQRIAEAVADVYLTDQVERKIATTERDSAWLVARLDRVRHDLEESELQVDAVRRKYGLLETDIGSGATLDRQAITGLNTQLIQARAEVTTLGARYTELQQAASGPAGLADVVDSPQITELRARQSDALKQLAALKAVYGDNYPEVRRLEEGQRTLQAQLDAEVARAVESARAAYTAAVARAQSVHDQLQRAIAAEDGTAGSAGHEQLRDAQRRAEENRGLYDALLTKWRGLQEQQTREEPEARIISQAGVPSAPSFPKPLLFPAGGAAGFMFLGLGFILLPVLLDTRFSSAAAAEQRLGLPVLGAIPLLRQQDLKGRRRRRNIVDYPSQQPLSRFAESLRMMRAFLRIAPDGGSTILQVTSALSGEGKSTVAATLAVSAASAGISTALVDADVRSASISEMFGLRHAPGLTDVIETDIPSDSVLHKRDDMPLAVLGAGSALLPRPDALESGRFSVLLRELAEHYQLVILDSPPALPVSDALVISRHADVTVLVVQWRATTRGVATQALKVLRAAGAPLAGVMLNKIDIAKIGRYERGYPAYAGTAVDRARRSDRKLGRASARNQPPAA
jgi:capsular exopolysaccharide synthesis family protein